MTERRMVRLGECCTVVSGATPSTANNMYWGGDIPWATPKDLSMLSGRRISQTSDKLTHAGFASCSVEMLPAGSVLLSSRAPIGLVAVNDVPMCTNQGFKSLVPGPDVVAEYLYWCLRYYRPSLEAAGSGSTFKELSKEVVARFEIPLPSVAVQRRIATALDKADDVERERASTLPVVDDLLRAAFQKYFGDPSTNDRNWPIVRASQIISQIEAGTSVKGESRTPRPGEWSVLKISAVTSGWYAPAECKVVTAVPVQPVVPIPGDLLFSRANTRELVAATCLVDEAADVFLPDKLWRLRLDSSIATPEYVRYLFGDPRFRMQLTSTATGTSGSMLNVSQSKLLRFEIPLPSLQEQRSFAGVVHTCYELRQKLREASGTSRSLSESLSARFFA